MNTELMSVNHIVSTQKYFINFRWVCRWLIQNKLPRKFKVVVNKEIKTHLFFWKIFLWPVNIARTFFLISSVQFSRSVVSDSWRPHESKHTRPHCPSPTLEFTQTHVHRVGDAIQPSHPLSSPSPPAPNPSQHQSLFQWVNSSCEVVKVLEFQL